MNSTARGEHNSPNIYTREVIIPSNTTKSIGVTTLGLVGETLIGPAFQPIPISTYNEFKTYFGGANPEKYPNGYPRYELGYIAKSYLEQSQQLYVTRVLGLSGYKFDGTWAINIFNGSYTENETDACVILRSKSTYLNDGEALTPLVTGITSPDITGITNLTDSFDIVVNLTSGTTETYNVSLNPLAKNYIVKVLGNDLKSASNSKIFVEEIYNGTITNAIDIETTNVFYTGTSFAMTDKLTINDDYSSPFSYAKTPWFVSEKVGDGSNGVLPLFRFITLSDGVNANSMFKVSIQNVNTTTLTFDVVIRQLNDTDAKPVILEQFLGCSMNPNDTKYIGKQIGTANDVYKLQSKYIILDIDTDAENIKSSVPMGFSGYEIKNIEGVTGATSPRYNLTYTDTGSVASKKPYFGLTNSARSNVDSDLFKYKGKLNVGTNNIVLTKGFHLDHLVGKEFGNCSIQDPYTGLECGFDTVIVNSSNIVLADKKLMKFTAYFSGGFDGWDIFRNNRTTGDGYQYYQYLNNVNKAPFIGETFNTFGEGELETNYNGIPNVPVTTGLTSDFYAFWSAARSFADPEFVDINVFATPGIDFINNQLLVNEIIDMVENERRDSIYVVTTPDKPIGAGDSKAEMYSAAAISEMLDTSEIDSSYTTTYFPWSQYLDTENGTYLYLPATRDVVKNIAYTDNTVYSWFPPSGIGRGSVDCVKAKKSLVLADEDILYGNRINIIKTFAIDGVKIWGQKTLQIADNSLNRIGTRRMMLYLRKAVRRANLPLIFEPNDNTTKTKFLEIVNPILNAVKTNRGIEKYEVRIDDSAEAKARHEMNVKIYVLPIGALEYINIDFMITPDGFDFSTI